MRAGVMPGGRTHGRMVFPVINILVGVFRRTDGSEETWFLPRSGLGCSIPSRSLALGHEDKI